MNKKALSFLFEDITYLLITILFFSMLFIFVAKSGTGADVYENIYAKKIGLLIDSASPGMIVKVDISDIIKTANSFGIDNSKINNIFFFDNNQVTVKLATGKGYSFNYFTKAKIKYEIKNQILILTLENE